LEKALSGPEPIVFGQNFYQALPMHRLSDSHFYWVRLDLADHPAAVILALAFCVWTSLWLIVRLWVVHRGDSLVKRLVWSLVLGVPLFGWVAYGAFYTPLAPNTARACGLRYGQQGRVSVEDDPPPDPK
jgi:hypothetical protein